MLVTTQTCAPSPHRPLRCAGDSARSMSCMYQPQGAVAAGPAPREAQGSCSSSQALRLLSIWDSQVSRPLRYRRSGTLRHCRRHLKSPGQRAGSHRRPGVAVIKIGIVCCSGAIIGRQLHGDDLLHPNHQSFPPPRPVSCYVIPSACTGLSTPRHGAANGSRTRDPHLGRVVLCHLSYCRIFRRASPAWGRLPRVGAALAVAPSP